MASVNLPQEQAVLQRSPRPGSLRTVKIFRSVVFYVVLIAFAIVTSVPFVYMISGSFKKNSEMFSYPLTFIPREPITENYRRLVSGEEIPFVQQVTNSTVTSISQTLLSLFVSSLVGW